MQVIRKSLIGLLCVVPMFCHSETITLDNNNGETIALPTQCKYVKKWNGKNFFAKCGNIEINFNRSQNAQINSDSFTLFKHLGTENHEAALSLIKRKVLKDEDANVGYGNYGNLNCVEYSRVAFCSHKNEPSPLIEIYVFGDPKTKFDRQVIAYLYPSVEFIKSPMEIAKEKFDKATRDIEAELGKDVVRKSSSK